MNGTTWFDVVSRDFASLLFLDTLAKATLVLAAACLTAALLRRAPAALRHRMWCLTLIGLLCLPVLSSLLPSWRLPILPAMAEAETPITAPPPSSPIGPEEPSAGITETSPAYSPFEQNPGHEPPRDQWAGPPSLNAPDGQPDAIASQPSTRAIPPALSGRPTVIWPIVLGSFWLLGAAVVLLPVVVGLVHSRLLAHSAQPVVDAELTQLLADACHQLGVSRDVRLLETSESVIPMTWGLLRPVVLLPLAWRAWSPQRQRIVLLHELAHVKRLDVAFQLLARLACAVYWFHPLAWYALRRVRVERELACDDCVLMAGERPSDYAQQLVEIARSCRSRPLPVAVAMACSSQLERRVRALLDQARSHLPMSRLVARLSLVGAVLVVTMVAMVRPAPTSEPKPQPSAEAVAGQADSTNEAIPESSALRESRSENSKENGPMAVQEMHLRGTVLSPQGKPVPGATLWWNEVRPAEFPVDMRLVRRGTTDQQGRFELKLREADFDPPNWFLRAGEQYLVATAKGYGLAWALIRKDQPPQAVTLKLVEDIPVRGRIVDAKGTPVKDAAMSVAYLLVPSEGNLDRYLSVWKRDYRETHGMLGDRLLTTLNEALDIQHDSASGSFEIRGLGTGRLAFLQLRSPSIIPMSRTVILRQGFDAEPYNRAAYDQEPEILRHLRQTPQLAAPEFTLHAEAGKTLEGVVVEADGGEPIPDVRVDTTIAGVQLFAKTDKEGRFRLTGLAPGEEHSIYCTPPHESSLLVRRLSLPDEGGLQTQTVKLELRRGIAVNGQVKDRQTGKGVAAGIRFAPLPDNQFFGQPGFDAYKHDHATRSTEPDGRFRLVIIPGPGVLMAQVHGSDLKIGDALVSPYRDAEFSKEDRPRVTLGGDEEDHDRHFKTAGDHLEFLSNQNAVKVLDFPPDAGAVQRDLEVDPGRTAQIEILDPQGEPVRGTLVAGVTADWPITYQIPDSRCTIYALAPQELRTLFLLHLQRKLGGTLTLTADSNLPVPAPLLPCGTVSGRALAPTGHPLADADVALILQDYTARELYREVAKRVEPVKTDAQGRFRLENVVPDMKFRIYFRQGNNQYIDTAKWMQVESGKTLELGDLPVKQRPSPKPAPVKEPPKADAKASSGQPVSRDSRKQSGKGSSETPATQDGEREQAVASNSGPEAVTAKTIGGKVIDEAGKPVAGAEIHMWPFRRQSPIPPAKTDVEGRFALVIPAAWAGKMRSYNSAQTLWAYAAGHCLGTGNAYRQLFRNDASEVVIQLGPVADTSVVVLNPEGRPQPGALVEPYYMKTAIASEPVPEKLRPRVQVYTDAEGRAKLPSAPRDILQRVRITTKDFGTQVQRLTEVTRAASVEETIHLRPVGKIDGQVIAEQPEMARGVRLVFTTEESLVDGLGDVESDEQGRFTIPAIAVGYLRIEAYTDETSPLRPRIPESTFSVSEGETTAVQIEMAPTVLVRGSILAANTGRPIPDAAIYIRHGKRYEGTVSVSDAQGRFTARVLPGGVAQQVVYMPEKYVQLGDMMARSYEVPEDATEFDLPPLEVVPAKSITGRLIDAQDQPIADAWIHIIEGKRAYGSGNSDANGQFNLIDIPATMDIAQAKYRVVTKADPATRLEAEAIQTAPLILRVRPTSPR